MIVWRDILGLESYQVSNTGMVRRNKPGNSNRNKNTPFLLRQHTDRDGYKYVILFGDNQKRCKRFVHRIMAESFLQNTAQKKVVCHTNGVPSDNRLENIRWDTQHNNILDKVRHGTQKRGAANWNSKLTPCQAIFSKYSPKYRGFYEDYAKVFGVASMTIKLISYGRNWSHV